MSSIIPFRFGTTAERQTGDLSGLLAVGTEAVSISALALDRAAPAVRDWTNQEMADLARVQFLLSRAGVPLETDRGLTDEGDPWFVFCDAQGEVFVHICRMGMMYLLDGPSLEAPLRGPNFESLVKGFIDRATAKVAALNVVPLDKGNKVFLHPSVMLAALIWSLFLLTDQMTNAAYASGLVPTEDEDAPAPAHHDIEGAFGLLAEALKEGGNDIDRMIANKVIGKDGFLVHPVGGIEKAGAHPQPLLSPIIVTSLSSIALAFGLLQPAESFAAASAVPSDVNTRMTDEGRFITREMGVNEQRTDKYQHDDQIAEVHQTDDASAHDWTYIVTFLQLPELNGRIGLATTEFLNALLANAVRSNQSDGELSLGHLPIAGALEFGIETAGPGSGRSIVMARSENAKVAPAHIAGEEIELSTKTSARANGELAFEKLTTQITKSVEGLIVVHSITDSAISSTKVVGHLHEQLLTNFSANTSAALKLILKLEDPALSGGGSGTRAEPEAHSGNVAEPSDALDEIAEVQHSQGTTSLAEKTGSGSVAVLASTSNTDAQKLIDSSVTALALATPSKEALGTAKTETMPVYAAPALVSSAVVSATNSSSLNLTASTKFDAYSDAARGLVDFLLAKQKDIIVIRLDNEVVILDKTALDEVKDVAYAHSWSVAGGGVVSTVGHYADYKDFGLLS